MWKLSLFNRELGAIKSSLFKTCSRLEYSFAFFAYCQEFLPFLISAFSAHSVSCFFTPFLFCPLSDNNQVDFFFGGVAYGACWVCLCCHNPSNSDMDYTGSLSCAQMLMRAIAHGGVHGQRKRVCTES